MSYTLIWGQTYNPWPVVDAAGGLGGAAGLVLLAGVHGGADASVALVAGGAGAHVLGGAGVGTGGQGVARPLQAGVDSCRGREGGVRVVNTQH